MAFSPNGKLVAAGDYKTVKLVDIDTGKEVAQLHSPGGVNSVVFSSDGQMLAAAVSDKTVMLWDTGTWKELATLTGHTRGVSSVAFSPDDNILASASYDKTVETLEC